jgi:hypothetical protein
VIPREEDASPMTDTEIDNDSVDIDVSLVRELVGTQFPQWADLPIKPVASGGWDNRTFHLGEHMTVRLPSAAAYAQQVEKEQRWLPRLAPLLPLPIPVPLAMGRPAEGYPWPWSIYRWIEGENAAIERIADLSQFATTLAHSSSPCSGSMPPTGRRLGSTTSFAADRWRSMTVRPGRPSRPSATGSMPTP